MIRIVAVALLLWSTVIAAAETATQKTAVFSETPSSTPLVETLERAGYRIDTKADEASLLFVGGKWNNAETVKRVVSAVRAGKTVVLNVRVPSKMSPELNAMVPINGWTFNDGKLRRWNVAVDFPKPLAFESAYDLHLPGSSIENSQHRYLYAEYEKPLNNADWRILTSTREGVPFLLAARVANAKVYVFAANWNDRFFLDSPGRDDFLNFFIADLSGTLDESSGLSDRVELSIPVFQPDGPCLVVKNPDGKPVKAAIACQITNWEREILNVETFEVDLKPRETKTIKLRERGWFKGDPKIVERGSSLPYRRIRAAVLSPDRLSVGNELRQNVLTAKPVDISIVEHSERWPREEFYTANLEDREFLSRRSATDGSESTHRAEARMPTRPRWEEIDNGADGTVAGRFIWPTGASPELTIRVGNRFCNIAPLAEARDETAPDNPSTEGLNDLSLSRANVRRNGKMQGGWDGGIKPKQKLSFRWPGRVVVAGIGVEAYGPERLEDRTQPKNLLLTSGDRTLLDLPDPEYTANGSTMYTRCFAPLTPQAVESLGLSITKFSPRTARINLPTPSNCSIKELELFGWPTEDARSVDGELQIIARDLVAGISKTLKTEKISIPPYSRTEKKITLPARAAFGPVRYDIVFQRQGKVLASAQYDVLFVPPGRRKIVSKKSLGEWKVGLLCTPGWVNHDDFDWGMQDWTQGWGGPHDKIRALTLGLMETGRDAVDRPERMLTTEAGNSHYTNPWRSMPDGTCGWDVTADNILREALEKKVESVWIVGSDRWNGIPINNSFGWDTFIRFDRHLRETAGKGIEARSRKGIADEIVARHYDTWQSWHMDEYAKKIAATKKRFEEHGIRMTFETHGSFPFCGGEQGARLAETHAGVGTDVFWELRNQDLYWSLATRFAVVAANPDLESGLYKQWGWINSESNMFWFANNGPVEPARRQWYSTYFMGRVDSKGRFLPYHVMGYGLQGGVSTKFYRHEIENSLRTFEFTRFVRPERPAGYGFVVSWDAHLRRMKSNGDVMGFGLYASGGPENQLEHRMGVLYEKLVKHGLPIGFVASSHTLKNWKEVTPLVLLDASDWRGDELKTVARLNRDGAPIVAFGGDDRSPEALKFWIESAVRQNIDGIEYFVRETPHAAPLIYCPANVSRLPPSDIAKLVDAMMQVCRLRIACSTPLVVNPFISNDTLFLAFGSMSDRNVTATVHFDSAEFLPSLKGKTVRVVDVDRFEEIKPTTDGGHSFPCEALSGRLLMVAEKE